MKADLAIYNSMLGVPGQYKNIALLLALNFTSVVVPIKTVLAETVTNVFYWVTM